MSRKSLLLASVALFAAAGVCHADTVLAFNGFESGTGDWHNATQTASGTGGITAYDGNFYGTLNQGAPDSYQAGYAYGDYSFFGFPAAQPYPGSPFSQQIAVYINVNTPAPADPSTPAFWIDTSPSSTGPLDVANNGGTGFGGEHSYRLTYTGSSVSVSADGATALANITTSGWYTFQTVYAQGATAASTSTATLNVIGPDGTTVLGSTTLLNTSDADPSINSPLLSSELGGPGYEWLTVWQNGFSGGNLAIDDVEAIAFTPEPSSFLLLGTGLFGVAVRMRRRFIA